MEAVIAIVQNENGQTLITKRRDTPLWVLPGGGVDPGENPELAAVREVEEETGLKVEIKRKIGIYRPLIRLAVITHVYLCEVVGGEMTCSDEVEALTLTTDFPHPFFYVHEFWIAEANKNVPPVEKLLVQVTYCKLIKYLLNHPIISFKFLFKKIPLLIKLLTK